MYAMFPSFALARSKAGISIRDAAGRIGVSYTYLSQMEDFLVVPSPDTKTQRKEYLSYAAKEFMQYRSKAYKRPFSDAIEPAVSEKPHEDQLSLEADYTFFILQKTWWNNLLLPFDGKERIPGPLCKAILNCYFADSKDNGDILLLAPQKSDEEPFLFDVIANFCERYYNSESFRRRRPRNWSATPPFVGSVGTHGVVFKSDVPESSRQVFNAHPTGNYFALFLLYSILKEMTMSTGVPNCMIGNMEDIPPAYGFWRNSYSDSIQMSWRKEQPGQSKPICHARFILKAPAYYVATPSEHEAGNPFGQYTSTPEGAVIRVCVKDVYSTNPPWCYCVAPAHC